MASNYLKLTDIQPMLRFPTPTNKYEQELNINLGNYFRSIENALTNYEQVTVLGSFTITPQASAPSSPTEGQVYYNSTDHKLKVYNGTIWEDCN